MSTVLRPGPLFIKFNSEGDLTSDDAIALQIGKTLLSWANAGWNVSCSAIYPNSAYAVSDFPDELNHVLTSGRVMANALSRIMMPHQSIDVTLPFDPTAPQDDFGKFSVRNEEEGVVINKVVEEYTMVN